MVNPVVVLAVATLVIALNGQRKNSLYLLPLVVLGGNSISCLVFWALRLMRQRAGSWFIAVLTAGYLSQIFGYIALIALIVVIGIVVIQPTHSGTLGLRADPKFWVLWCWATLEILHHHVYKLILGSHDTLQYVLENGRLSEARRPLGGAIGVQLRKLTHHHMRLQRKPTMS
jgi:hypothetical protein